MVAGADGLVDREGKFHLVADAALHALHLEARGIEHQVLEIVELGPGDRQFDVSANLAAVRLQRGHAGISRPRGERGEEERGKGTELHKNVSAGRSPPAAPKGGRMGFRRRFRPTNRS